MKLYYKKNFLAELQTQIENVWSNEILLLLLEYFEENPGKPELHVFWYETRQQNDDWFGTSCDNIYIHHNQQTFVIYITTIIAIAPFLSSNYFHSDSSKQLTVAVAQDKNEKSENWTPCYLYW